MNINSIITLDGKINCLILDKTQYKENNYFLTVVLDNNGEPTDDNVILKSTNENGNIYLEREEDESILADLLVVFARNLNQFVNENEAAM